MYIAAELIAERTLSKIKKLEIIQEGDSIWLYFEVTEKKKGRVKEGEPKEYIKAYKYDLAKSWGFMQEMYETYVATDMLRRGYMLIAIEGGWLVLGGTEPYQLESESCTCRDFNTRLNRSSQCKHLIFKNWHLTYRSKCARARSEITTGQQ